MVHIPVLQKEVLQYLDPKPNENFIDCTINGAGHTLAILEKNSPRGRVLGIDADTEIIKKLRTELPQEAKVKKRTKFSSPFKKRLIVVCDNFANLKEIVKREKFGPVSGIMLDLGMSSWHLEESSRGFSFLKNEPLDMRYDLRDPLTAEKIINFWSEPDIEKILREFGEEKFAGKIAEALIKERKITPIKTTFQLVKIIKKVITLPSSAIAERRWRRGRSSLRLKYQYQRIHCATRTFQAIRIAVNKELDNLRRVLPQAIEILPAEGKLIVISFHSLEDRIVKNFFSTFAKGYGGQAGKIKILTKKPITPSENEIKINPRSRSGKLRAAAKI